MTRTRYIRQSAAIAIALSIHAAAVAGVLYDCSLPEPATHQGSGGVTMIVAATAAGAVAGSGAASGTADSGKPVPERPLEPTPEQTVPPHAPEIQPDPEPALPTARIPPDAPTTSPSPEVEIERHAWLKQVVPAPPTRPPQGRSRSQSASPTRRGKRRRSPCPRRRRRLR
jgi:outer membrane biosynthesis protein TonB